MQAILLSGHGGPEVMRLGDAPRPTPGVGEVLIRVAATSVNRPDVMQREGQYPPPPGASEILGLEAAGTIEALGPQVTGFAPGQRVAALLAGGGYAEYVAAPAGQVIPLPDSLGFAEAAGLCETYITAYMNLILGARLADGETVLLHGGGGGVTTAAMQIVRALTPACRLIVTASAGKLDRVAALGADLVIDYRAEPFAEAVLEHTGGRGADVILDHIGASYLAPNLKALAIGGRLALIGVMSGRQAEIDLGRLLVKRQTISGSVLRPRPLDEKARIVAAFAAEVMPHVAARRVVPLVDRVFRLSEAAAAHRYMDARRHFGKIVLEVSGQ